ncbi:MAG: Rieske 2Fe-2S domain-containing protein, partial [Cyclobacteriaceae bacterium]|nr:Rieske 2Fe-2S domain-containing protein [Cyclobacteriaceae bacterium]
MSPNFSIDPDIRKAETLPASFYRDPEVFSSLRDKLFLKSWQWIGDESAVKLNQHVHPFILLDGFLTEPMALTRDEGGKLHCVTNVCTHRGNLIAHSDGPAKSLRCLYHGRRFGLDGAFEHMPEFKETIGFPRACDDLHRFPLEHWG